MPLKIQITHVNIVVTHPKWKPKRLADMPIEAVHCPEYALPQLDVFQSKARVPDRTSMQPDLERHPHDQAAQPRSCIMPEHGDEENLHAEHGLDALDRRWCGKSPLNAVDR